MRNMIRMIAISLLVAMSVSGCGNVQTEDTHFEKMVYVTQTEHISKEPVHKTVTQKPIVKKVAAPAVVEKAVSEADIHLIALVTMAEAEGEPEYGKRLVIDTILNRIDDPHFPSTARKVIYQPGHFSSMWNGRADRCWVKEDICKLVREELASRTNRKVVFFQAGRFSHYGRPMFKVGAHYFSSYC